MDSPTLRARARRSLGYRGWRRTLRVGGAFALYRLRRGWRAPRPHAFDLEFGVDTVSLERGGQVLGDASLGNPHEPVDTVDFAELISDLVGVAPGFDFNAFTFIDFGSGQGRALMLASQYPFARIAGLEYARELYESAQRNLAIWARRRFAGQRCARIENLWVNAATWALPLVPSVFYLCEPFQAPMMRLMMERVRDSLRAHPRPAYVLYIGERHRAPWEESGDFEVAAARYFSRIYRLRPEVR